MAHKVALSSAGVDGDTNTYQYDSVTSSTSAQSSTSIDQGFSSNLNQFDTSYIISPYKTTSDGHYTNSDAVSYHNYFSAQNNHNSSLPYTAVCYVCASSENVNKYLILTGLKDNMMLKLPYNMLLCDKHKHYVACAYCHNYDHYSNLFYRPDKFQQSCVLIYNSYRARSTVIPLCTLHRHVRLCHCCNKLIAFSDRDISYNHCLNNTSTVSLDPHELLNRKRQLFPPEVSLYQRILRSYCRQMTDKYCSAGDDMAEIQQEIDALLLNYQAPTHTK